LHGVIKKASKEFGSRGTALLFQVVVETGKYIVVIPVKQQYVTHRLR